MGDGNFGLAFVGPYVEEHTDPASNVEAEIRRVPDPAAIEFKIYRPKSAPRV